MKATVSVCRTGYAHAQIEVEIPKEALYKTMKNGKKRHMFKREVVKLFEEKAADQAGDASFSEHSSEYEPVGISFL